MYAKILITDEKADIRERIARMLAMEGHRPGSAVDVQDNPALQKKLDELSIKAPLTQVHNCPHFYQHQAETLLYAWFCRQPLSSPLLNADQTLCSAKATGWDRSCRAESAMKNEAPMGRHPLMRHFGHKG